MHDGIRRQRGQVESYDMMFAVMIFLAMFSVFISIFSGTINKVGDEVTVQRSRQTAHLVADILVLTPGNPANWHRLSDYNYPGLAVEKRVMNSSRLDFFKNQDYNRLRAKMGLGEKDFYVKIDQDFNTVFEKGTQPSREAAINVERVVEYSGKPAVFTFRLYKEG